MKKKGRRGFSLLFICFLLLAACSNAEDKTVEPEKGEEVTDEELISVVETNVTQLMEKDFDGYMATIHTDSPVYDSTSKTIGELFNYTLDIELSDLSVKGRSAEEAIVLYTQQTEKLAGSDFQDNVTVGEHLLKPDNGDWKIYKSEIVSVDALEVETDDPEEPGTEAVDMEGAYVDIFTNLENPFESDEWVLANYVEGEGEAAAEYISPEENLGNYSKMATIDYYENGNELSGLKNFISVFQLSLEEMTTGELEFEKLLPTETEVLYEFTLTKDATEEDQQEIGRVIVMGNDIYLVRYTVIDDTIEDKEEIIETLREVK